MHKILKTLGLSLSLVAASFGISNAQAVPYTPNGHLAIGINPCYSETVTPTLYSFSQSTAGTYTLGPAGVAGQHVYVCGLYLYSGGTNTVTLGYGTGTNCTTFNAISGGFPWVSGSSFALPFEIETPTANQFCIQLGSGVSLTGMASIVQQ